MSSTVRSAAVRLTMENASYIRGANQSAAVTEAATGRMQRSVRNAAVSTGRDWDTMGKYGGRTAVAVGAGLALVAKTTADFASEMALVRTLSHANAADMEALSHAALTVGRNIGYSAKEVAQGEEEMIKAGVSVKDILGGGLKGALDLAAAGQTDVATATTIAASAMTQFQLKGKDIPHLADLLSAGADKALGSVEDLGYGLEQSGTTAHQMGLSIEQTVGTLAAFAQAGLTGERGGTTFKQMLLQLAAPTTQAQKLMDKYHLSLYNANGQIKTMPQLAGNLRQAFGKLDPASRNAALGVIFGSRAIQGANILMADGRTEIAKWISKVNDQGFAAHQASGKLDSLNGDVKKLKSTLSTAFIEAGSPSQKALRSIVQDADHLVRAFQGLPDDIQQGIVKTAALTTAIGGSLWVASKVRNVVRDLGSIGRGGVGRGKGVAGALGDVASSAKPVPVYVTNLGPGGLGTPGAPGGSKPPVVAPTGKPPKGAPLGALGLGLGLGFASAGGLTDHGLNPADRPAARGNFVIDDKFLKTHVVVDGHWFTKTEWDKQKEASNDALLWLLSGGKKGAPSGRKPPKALQDPLGPLFHPSGSPKTPKVKPVTLLGDVRGLADVFGKPTGAKAPKNPVTKLEASLGLDTGPFDRKAGSVRKSAKDLDSLHMVPRVDVSGVPAAMGATTALKRLIDSLHDRNIHINVTKTTNANLAEAQVVGADGLTVPHAANGWTVTGQRNPYGDKVLAYLAPGEEVITNRHGEADRFRADRAAGRIPAYADGSAATLRVTAGGQGLNYTQIAAAVTANQLLAHRGTRDAMLSALRIALQETPVQRVPRSLMDGMSV